MTALRQFDLFGAADVAIDEGFTRVKRTVLPAEDEAWIDHQSAWLSGHETVFDRIRQRAEWRSERRQMYDREVDTPRLLASTEDLESIDPILERARRFLSERYGGEFRRVSFALYRDGRDSVAMHGDTIARDIPRALVATLSLGSARRFLLKPTMGGVSQSLTLGGGDLLVMGGSAQRTWRHGIPKVAHAGPRIAVMFRPIWIDDTRT